MASNLRKRRGVVRASITHLEKRLEDLDPTDLESVAVGCQAEAEFRAVHLQLINLIDGRNGAGTGQFGQT